MSSGQSRRFAGRPGTLDGGSCYSPGVMSVTGVVTAAATVTKSATASAKAVGFGARPGYSSGWLAFTSGTVVAYGGAPNLGSAPAGWGQVTGIAATPDGHGYWLLTGTARPAGSATLGPTRPWPAWQGGWHRASGDGHGYLLLTSDGRVYSRGDAVARGGAPGTARAVHRHRPYA